MCDQQINNGKNGVSEINKDKKKKEFDQIFWRGWRNWWTPPVVILSIVILVLCSYTISQNNQIKNQNQTIQDSLDQLTSLEVIHSGINIDDDKAQARLEKIKLEQLEIAKRKLFPLIKWANLDNVPEDRIESQIEEFQKDLFLDSIGSYLKRCDCTWRSIKSIEATYSPCSSVDPIFEKIMTEKIEGSLAGIQYQELYERNYTQLAFIIRYRQKDGKEAALIIIDDTGPLG